MMPPMIPPVDPELSDAYLFEPSRAEPDPVMPKALNVPGGPPKSAALGAVGSSERLKLRNAIVDIEMHYRGILQRPFSKMTEWWKLYLAKKRDRRKENEKWRANVAVPYPYSGIETMVAAITDILLSADPPIQPEAIFEKDEKYALPVQRLLDYTFRQNKWPEMLDLNLRSMGVQGTVIPWMTWAKRSQVVYVRPWSKDVEDWRKAVADAEQRTSLKMPQDPAAYEQWRKDVNTAGYAQIPELPTPGYKEIIDYEGPTITNESIFSFRFDPFIPDIQDQGCFIRRVVKPRNWLLRNTGPEPWKPFDPVAVEQSLRKFDGERFSTWQREIAEMMGIDGDGSSDPRYEDAVELFEVWRKETEHPHLIMLNRDEFINKPNSHGCYTMPYHHGMIPGFPIRNVPIEGHFLGISEIQPNEPLYKEMNSLRDLRLDAVTLAVLPVFLRLQESGLPELAHMLAPGMVFPSARADGIQQLLKYQPDIMNAFREIMEIKADIDETNATPPALRGGASTVGRVSATESERRFSQALVRQKQKVLRIEDALTPAVRMAQMLWLQFGSSQTRVRVAGSDPYLHISRDMLLTSLDMGFRFRGASKSINRDLAAQELMAFAKQFSQWLIPPEIRALMRRVYENMGQKGVAEIVSDPGNDFFKAIMQAQLQQAQLGPGGPGAPGAPGGPGAPPPGVPPGAAGQGGPGGPGGQGQPATVEGPAADQLVSAAAGGGA